MPGNRLGDIGAAIEAVADAHGYGIVRQFVGHGIGATMHEEPKVPNYGRPGTGMRIEAGMCFAIEPMFNLGGDDVGAARRRLDGRDRRRSISAHFEDTIAVTASGPEVLTPCLISTLIGVVLDRHLVYTFVPVAACGGLSVCSPN